MEAWEFQKFCFFQTNKQTAPQNLCKSKASAGLKNCYDCNFQTQK